MAAQWSVLSELPYNVIYDQCSIHSELCCTTPSMYSAWQLNAVLSESDLLYNVDHVWINAVYILSCVALQCPALSVPSLSMDYYTVLIQL